MKYEPGIYLHLYNGFPTRVPPRNEDDSTYSGDPGPLFGPLVEVGMAFNCELNVVESIDGGIEERTLFVVDDSIYYDGRYYGEWIVQRAEELNGNSTGHDLDPERIDEAKAERKPEDRWARSDEVKAKYAAWIAENVPDSKTARNACDSYTRAMAVEFPELARVRGHYHEPTMGRRPHWWLVDSAGGIVDPTARQFPSNGWGEYEPWDESRAEPIGKCMECGKGCFPDRGGTPHACSAACAAELDKMFN